MAKRLQISTGCIPALLMSAVLFSSCSSGSIPEWVEEQEGYRWADVSPGFFKKTGFEHLQPQSTGVDFVNRLSEKSIIDNQNLLNGSGVATGDIDGDGLVDLYLASLDGSDKLYRNLGGFHFQDITEESGLTNDGYQTSGVLLSDVDGDGDLDLLLSSLNQPNMLFLNDGAGLFQPVIESGLEFGRGSSTFTMADIDGDGDLDLYVTNYKDRTAKDIFDPAELVPENMITETDGNFQLIPPFDEHFLLIPRQEGGSGNEIPNIQEYGVQDELYLNDGNGLFQKVTDLENRFLDSDGNPAGLHRDWGLTAKFQDLNGDGMPDLYVCNDFWTPDRLWINQGDGTFRAIDEQAFRNQSFSSMAVDFSDINRDGNIDFFVSEMLDTRHDRRARQLVSRDPYEELNTLTDFQPQYMRNTLYLGRPDQTFAEITYLSGTEATGWSWATRFLDVNLDGYEDLIINTGHAFDVLDLDTQRELSRRAAGKGYILEYPSLDLTNVILQNNGDLTFTDTAYGWGFSEEDVSHGLATADFDNDGDLDLVTNRLNKTAAVFENLSTAPRIAVRLNGRTPNRQAIGAKIELTGGPVPQKKEVAAGGDYLSGSDPLVVFAAKDRDDNHRLTVTWPDGQQSVIDHVASNRIYEIDEPDSVLANGSGFQEEASPAFTSLFEDVSERLNYSHREDDFQEESVQPLLPVRLSRSGPAVASLDIDRDGDDDIIIGSAYGGSPAIFKNSGAGHFEQVNMEGVTGNVQGDVTSIIGWEEGNQTGILFGLSNYESYTASGTVSGSSTAAGTDNSVLASFGRNGGNTAGSPSAASPPSAVYQTTDSSATAATVQWIQGIASSTGVMAASDYNGDGAPDLFIGGRFIPGRYPLNADSRLFKNGNTGFILDEENTALLKEAGLVTGAVFTDYDGDGDQDLLISTEWGSLRLFRNTDGQFSEVTSSTGLDRYTGWWNGVATGDFNNDGRPDIIATNIGLNSSYQLQSDDPLKMYYADFNGDSVVEIVEAGFDTDMNGYVPRRDLHDLYASIPSILRNIGSYKDFAASTLDEILGVPLNSIPSRELNTLHHMVFINEGDMFSAHPLPVEAQFSTAFYAGVADFNNDGNEDLFLGQNQFSFPVTTPRVDAGRGVVLTGDGTGSFTALDGDESGIKIYGEQKGAALGDFNGDGKTDLIVSQNNNPVHFYLNRTTKSGIRIRLSGPEMNSSGTGSSLRLVYPDGEKGPRREIQAGAGYLSQNSTTQVLGMRSSPEAIEVTWFDGSIQLVELEQGKTSYVIGY